MTEVKVLTDAEKAHQLIVAFCDKHNIRFIYKPNEFSSYWIGRELQTIEKYFLHLKRKGVKAVILAHGRGSYAFGTWTLASGRKVQDIVNDLGVPCYVKACEDHKTRYLSHFDGRVVYPCHRKK